MKILCICLMLFFGAQASAQTPATATLTLKSVPAPVKTTFQKEFPNVQAKWEADGKNYKAVYADPKTNSKGIIVYNADGKAITRDTEANITVPE